MKDNILSTISQSISSKSSDEDIKDKIRKRLTDIDVVYSYIIYAKHKNDDLVGWIVQYNISQNSSYNTIKCNDIADCIIDTILANRNTTKYVIGYKQPSIDLMLNLFAPLIHKLALEQCDRWSELEYEDAVSMCKFVMCKLYIKGYYIHKGILKKSLDNYVLMELRHSRDKPEILSFDQAMYSDGDNGAITLGDMLPDRDAEIEAERKEDAEVFELIFEEVKAIIIEFIGERQFEQLLRDYGNKHTTSWSRKKMQQIKDKFKKLGITWKSFDR